jgi:hypothetical protein
MCPGVDEKENATQVVSPGSDCINNLYVWHLMYAHQLHESGHRSLQIAI